MTLWISRIPAIAALVFVAAVFGSHLYLTIEYRYLNPFSNAEEWAYTNIAADNFLRFGFLNSLFLQDFSHSPFPEDHPFVYNHMPAGPDNATAVLLWLTGHDYQLVRFIFALFVLPGLYFFVRFVRLLFEKQGLQGAPLVLLMVSPIVLISHMEAQIHSPFLLLGFAPLVWLIEHAQGKKGWRFPASFALLFVLSIYVQYILVAGIVFGLIWLWILRIANLRITHVVTGLTAIAAGVILHLVQNYIYFGPDIFFKELVYTLGNRTIGVPTKEELKSFYQSIFVVHHGSRAIDPGGFFVTIIRNLRVPQWHWITLLLFVFSVAWWRIRNIPNGLEHSALRPLVARFAFVIRLYVWAASTVVCVMLLFPAFAQEVNLGPYGVNTMFLLIPTLAAVLSALEVGNSFLPAMRGELVRYQVASCFLGMLVLLSLAWTKWVWLVLAGVTFIFSLIWTSLRKSQTEAVPTEIMERLPLMPLVVFFAGVITATAMLRNTTVDFRKMNLQVRQQNFIEPVSELKKYQGQLFMTNINLPLVGFFTSAPGYGVCEMDALGVDGEIKSEHCKVAFLRRPEFWKTQRPSHYIFFWDRRVFPGFADCFPAGFELPPDDDKSCISEMRSRLMRNYPLVEQTSLYEVYDLRGSTTSK